MADQRIDDHDCPFASRSRTVIQPRAGARFSHLFKLDCRTLPLQGRYGEAEPLFVRSLELREQQLEAQHPHVALSLNNLALLYQSQGRYGEAEPLYVRSLSILQNQLPADHPLTARVVSNLAHLYDLQGRYPEAESLYLQALPILSARLEENHEWRQDATNNWRSFLQKAIEAQRTDELSDNPMTQAELSKIRDEE
ncbi:MAG: tetratricopeptide repeat protein [Leptolyngbyaceae cyanobacterium SL_5_9]|nr:tetratricopeptide repeat protein [Leptolyngbyaceae cyanobacterium SL_5_9]